MPDGFLLLIESVIGRRSVAVDGKSWPVGRQSRRLRIVRAILAFANRGSRAMWNSRGRPAAKSDSPSMLPASAW